MEMFDDKETEVIGTYIKAMEENSTDQKASLGDKVDKLENIGEKQHIVGQCFLDTFYYNPHEEIDSYQEDPPSLTSPHSQTYILMMQKFYKVISILTEMPSNSFICYCFYF